MEIGNKVKVIQLSEYDKADTTLEIGDIGIIEKFYDNENVLAVRFNENKINEINKDSKNIHYNGTYDMFWFQVEIID